MMIFFNIICLIFYNLLFKNKVIYFEYSQHEPFGSWCSQKQYRCFLNVKEKTDKLKFVELWAGRLIIFYFQFNRNNPFVVLFCFQNVIYLALKRTNGESKLDKECR